jgi:Uma2 family endonuclease
MVTREKLYTAEEFYQIAELPENAERRLELEDGIIVEMPPSSPLNTVIAGLIITALNNHVVKPKLGYVTVPDGGFALSSGRVRQPDVAFISKKRQPTMPKHFGIAPDLAVEIVSTHEDVLKKVSEYIEAGTQLVWVVYPQERTVHIFRGATAPEPRWQTLGIDDTLNGETVLPGFILPVRDIFPEDE